MRSSSAGACRTGCGKTAVAAENDCSEPESISPAAIKIIPRIDSIWSAHPRRAEPNCFGRFAFRKCITTMIRRRFTFWCRTGFQQGSDATANLTALKKIASSWEQGTFLEKGGWATRPGAASPDYVLARACAEKLLQAKAAAQ